MALFGAPLTQEDHVRRAMLAALAVQRALGGGERRDAGQLNVPVRIGIHTGTVVFGPIADKLAARLHGDRRHRQCRRPAAAGGRAGDDPGERSDPPAGSGLCARRTGRAARPKGKDEPIMAYRLLGVSHRRSGLRQSLRRARRLSSTARASSRSCTISCSRSKAATAKRSASSASPASASPGSLAEFHRQLAEGRVTWVEGRCVSYGTAIPYWLLLDLLRSNCGMSRPTPPKRSSRRSARVCKRSGWIPTGQSRASSSFGGQGGRQRRRRCRTPKR